MKTSKNKTRVIKTIRWFKRAVKKSQIITAQTKENHTGFSLLNGFEGSLFIEGKTIAEAWREYRENFSFYDSYIPNKSFLRKVSI